MPLALVLLASSGFCNRILAVLLKLCKFSLYECKSVTGLENEDNIHPKWSCKSTLRQWHRSKQQSIFVRLSSIIHVIFKTK